MYLEFVTTPDPLLEGVRRLNRYKYYAVTAQYSTIGQKGQG
jgi:hypothetical protein